LFGCKPASFGRSGTMTVDIQPISEASPFENNVPEPSASRGGRVAVRLAADRKAGESLKRLRLKRDTNSKVKTPQKRGDDSRKRVVEAALECFGAFGYEGTSTRAVAERAGVTHTLVLYHFKSKEQLWLSMMEDALENYSASISTNLRENESRPASEALRVFIEQFVRLSAAHPQIHRIMTMEGNRETERLQWVIDHYLRDHFTVVRDLIKRGQAEGSVRECDAARLYYYIIGGGGTPYTLSVEYRTLTGRDVFSEAEIYRNIAFLFDIVFT
jgi:TetR/AcrR family transcriptional regulator